MTSQSPRIYLYKITFEEVPYYYYGVHKEKKFGEYYMGSPCTHKWCWKLYTPKKQILEVFDYTDEGWIEAGKVEQRLIRPFYNDDKWCLNECCGRVFSLDILRKHQELKIGMFKLTTDERRELGKRNGQKIYENGIGIHGFTTEQRKENGKRNYENGTAFRSLTTEERIEIGRRNGKKNYENGVGIHGFTTEQKSEIGKRNYENGVGAHGLTTEQRRENGKRNYELKIGFHSFTTEQRQEFGRKNCENGIGIHGLTTEQRSENSKRTQSQRFMCLETGFISSPTGLTNYQKKRDIDTSKRVKIS